MLDIARFVGELPEYIGRAVRPLSARIEELEKALGRIERLENDIKRMGQQVTAIESRGLKYCGIWQRAQEYNRGDCVTHKGGLWVALKATNQAPEQSQDWQLSAKGGH